jgi:predicted RecA/RadA family phage recombinase
VKNQFYTGTPTSRRFALCPATVKAGDPVLLGNIPAVALDDYQSITGGTVFLLNGTFELSVEGATVISPQTGHAINPGDPIHASGGTLDAPTNVTTGFTLSAVSADPLFGHLDPSGTTIASTTTDTAALVCLEG